MISINKNTVEKPTVLKDVDWISKKLVEIKEEAKPGKKIEGRYNSYDVKNVLNSLYHNKCGYCEGKSNTAKFSSRIDHYRPKNGIRANKLNIDNHKGYYWLGYEWTNLIPTCEKCNRNKSNQFPLKDENTRISDNLEKEGFMVSGEFIFERFDISKLTKEERLLLNPEIDDVEKHFYFLPSGEIKALTKEAEITIDVYDLNRSSLILERKQISDDIFRDILEIFGNEDFSSESYNDLLKKVWSDKVKFTDKDEYSRYKYFICNYFDFFIIKKFEMLGLFSFAEKLKTFFDSMINN